MQTVDTMADPVQFPWALPPPELIDAEISDLCAAIEHIRSEIAGHAACGRVPRELALREVGLELALQNAGDELRRMRRMRLAGTDQH